MTKRIILGSTVLMLSLYFGCNTRCDAATTETPIAGISVDLAGVDHNDIRRALYDFSDNDISLIEKVTEAEVGGCDPESKQNVASVILNRILNDSLSVHEVLFAPSQFSTISNGSYKKVKVDEETRAAVARVLLYGPTHKATHFCNPRRVKKKATLRWFNSLGFLFEDGSGTYYYN